MSFKSDYWSEVDLNKFLKKILLSKNGEKFLLHQVNDDVGLVEAPNNDALTWLALSQQQVSKIAWCMKDDDGEFEIQFYEPTIQGLDECIGEVYGRQDEINDLEKFKKEIISLSNEKLKVDKEVILAAVKQNGYALQYADEKLKANKEVILAAVKQDGNTLQYADKKLKANKEVVLAAVKQSGGALQYADEKLKADKKFILAAVKENGYALEYADEKLKANKEVVLAAVKENGYALEYADEKLKADKKIVLAAVKQDVSALDYVDDSLKNDPDILKILESSE